MPSCERTNFDGTAAAPDPSWLSGFDSLGPVAILVGALFGGGAVVPWVIRQFRTGALVTDIRHAEALANKEAEIGDLEGPLVAESGAALSFSGTEAELLRLYNEARTERGLAPLCAQEQLMAAARSHSEDRHALALLLRPRHARRHGALGTGLGR